MPKFKLSWLIGVGFICGLPLAVAEDINQAEQRFLALKINPNNIPTRINCSAKLRCSLALTGQFYMAESFVALWTRNGDVLPHAHALLAVIRDSYREGLNPLDYHLTELERLSAEIRDYQAAANNSALARTLADFEVTLSDALLLYAKHMVYGRVDNQRDYPTWIISKRSIDLSALLRRAAQTSLDDSLNELRPHYSGYTKLKAKLNFYQDIASAWESLPKLARLQIGSSGSAVRILQQRLTLTTESPTSLNFKPGLFDENTRRAVISFQQNNNLPANGIVAGKTRHSLNIPLAQRIKILALNLDRLRWLPLTMGWRYILVNIPNFSLDIIKDQQLLMTMPVIVGKETNRSCILNSQISYLELNPYWIIPEGIAKKELLPKLRLNANYLTADQIRVYTSFDQNGSRVNPLKVNWDEIDPANLNYKFRQEPGPKNALGRVKFIFPNDCGIYLHDTPSHNLFSKNRRDFSHGCIRIGKPIAMAEYLLADKSSWSPAKIESQIASGKRQVIFLNTPIAIHIIYATAWVDESGELQFRNDIYAIDNIDYPLYLPNAKNSGHHKNDL